MRKHRTRISELEEQVASEIGVEKVSVSNDYWEFAEYLRAKRGINTDIRKKLHEYTVFLHTLPSHTDASELGSKDKILFSPSEGKYSQSPTVQSMFVEPYLPPYPVDEFWDEHKNEYHHLKNPTDNTRYHTSPDLLIATRGVSELPWKAVGSPQPVDQSRLMKLCARGNAEKVAELLGIDDTPSSYNECTSLVQTEARKQSPHELYKNWTEFGNQAQYLIESKHEPLTEEDFSQILWYGIAFETDIVVISRYPIQDTQFKSDISRLPVDITVVSEVGLHTDTNEARSKIREATT